MSAIFPEFLMEDWLEKNRFSARFNAGESGHVAQSLESLLNGLQPDFSFSLRDALEAQMLSDAPNMGLDSLRQKVAALHPGANPENVLITTGTSEALFLLLRNLKPKKVAVVVPAFQLLIEIPRVLGAEILPLPVQWDHLGRPAADLSHWCELLREHRPDVLILNHPHNPSGLTFTPAELELLAQTAEDVGCMVVGDEHYRFLSETRAITGPTVYKHGRFVTGSFIKCAGTPGLRIGWCVGDADSLEEMQSEKNYLTHTVNPLSQMLAVWFLESLNTGQAFFKPLHDAWKTNRSILQAWIDSGHHGWRGHAPDGGLVSCLFPTSKNPSYPWFENLREQGIFLLPLSTFKESFSLDSRFLLGFRVGLGLPPDELKKMLSVMVLC